MEVAAAAAASPVPNSNDTNGSTPPRRSKQTLRGLNKPKCIKCGNVARSRCPYQSCKSCCAKAENPCYIHVLKQNSTLPDKPPSSGSPLFDQSSSDVSTTGSSLRVSSLRQLSNNFAQFNRAHIPLRARRPLSRKDAAAINAWRFSKLKDHNDSNVEAENEAFDRYMQNVSLLEEAFFVDPSSEGLAPDGPLTGLEATTSGVDEPFKMISGMKARLKSNIERADNFRKRLRDLVDQGLRKLQRSEFDDEGRLASAEDSKSEKELRRPQKADKWWCERSAAVNDLLDKLTKARTMDELKVCMETKLPLFGWNESADSLAFEEAVSHENEDGQTSYGQSAGDTSIPRQESGSSSSSLSLPNLCRAVEINQEALSNINTDFSSLDKIADL
ncbi:uncharacterized protein LOC131248111 [Magnolia sinica]|uniref:uncharacterized protein LOC131248111 n=1 Tax=Magnolia sinica TaxID=86752 RepID=UPI002657FD31|nr:uncharacterized protein LOC131248111 [Magnolia sinica]